MEQLTDWIDGSIKPVRDGVYQRKYTDYCDTPIYCMFKNGKWLCGSDKINSLPLRQSGSQSLPWRGLAQDPNQDSKDAERMDWLESHCVEVRLPLRYGSQAMFHAQTISDDDEPHKTNLRELIDEEIAKAKK